MFQMGSQMKKSIFDEQTSKALMSWHNKVKKKHEHDHDHDHATVRTRKLGGSPGDSPEHSPRQLASGAAGIAESSIEMSDHKKSGSPKEQMTDIDLLTGPWDRTTLLRKIDGLELQI